MGQGRQVSEDRYSSELFEGTGVVGMVWAIEDQPQHRQLTTVEGFQAQQCVVQGAESAARHQNNR